MDSNLTTTTLSTTAATTEYPTDYHIYWGYTCDIWMPVYLAIVVLYAFELWILWTTQNPKYKSCYFTIFIVTGIADVIDAVAIEYIRFSQRVGMGPSFGWLLQITTAITGSNYTMHLVGNALMSIFQFTAVWFPMPHNSFWKKRTCYILLIVMIVVSIGVYSHLLFTEFIFVQDDIGRWRYKTRKDPITKTRILDSVLQVSQSIISGCTSGAVIIGIRMKTEASFKKNIPEKSLVLVEIINVIFGSMETLYGLISLLHIPITNPVLDFIYNEFVSYFFLMVCLNAITLPLLSKTMRQEMLWWKRNAIDSTGERSTTSKVTTNTRFQSLSPPSSATFVRRMPLISIFSAKTSETAMYAFLDQLKQLEEDIDDGSSVLREIFEIPAQSTNGQEIVLLRLIYGGVEGIAHAEREQIVKEKSPFVDHPARRFITRKVERRAKRRLGKSLGLCIE